MAKRWGKAKVIAGDIAFGGADCQRVLPDKAEMINQHCRDLIRLARQMSIASQTDEPITCLDWHYAAEQVVSLATNIMDELYG